jgi:hypothetical protein
MFSDDLQIDTVFNGECSGDVATRLIETNGDVRCLRPYKGRDGRSYIDRLVGNQMRAVPVNNAVATLRKMDWIQLDEAIIKAAKPRLRAFGDLRSSGLSYVIPNGMGKTSLEYQTQSDISLASIGMDGLTRGQSDRPIYDLRSLPLPIIHKDFSFSARQVMASRNNGHMPIDTSTAELAARRVAEAVEQLLLGTYGGNAVGSGPNYQFGGGSVYGYTNFPQRGTYSMINPTSTSGIVTMNHASGSYVPIDTVTDILNMRLQSQMMFHYGPWMIYNSPAWDIYLDADMNPPYATKTLRQRIKEIDGIMDVRTLDYLGTQSTLGSQAVGGGLAGYTATSGQTFEMVMVQMTSDVARAVVGMDVTTVQWETMGGMQLNFKVMCILVPQLRYDQNGNTGIIHAVAAAQNTQPTVNTTGTTPNNPIVPGN